MTDFRELCSELLQALDEIAEYKVVDLDWIKSKPLKMASESMRDARAALDAAPEGEEMQRLLDAPIDARWYADLRRPAGGGGC